MDVSNSYLLDVFYSLSRLKNWRSDVGLCTKNICKARPDWRLAQWHVKHPVTFMMLLVFLTSFSLGARENREILTCPCFCSWSDRKRTRVALTDRLTRPERRYVGLGPQVSRHSCFFGGQVAGWHYDFTEWLPLRRRALLTESSSCLQTSLGMALHILLGHFLALLYVSVL